MLDRNYWKQMLPIIQAYADGETIEYFDGLNWTEGPKYGFSDEPGSYRIRPSFREYTPEEAKKLPRYITVQPIGKQSAFVIYYNHEKDLFCYAKGSTTWTRAQALKKLYHLKPDGRLIPFGIKKQTKTKASNATQH
jgi:hypothetical protein